MVKKLEAITAFTNQLAKPKQLKNGDITFTGDIIYQFNGKSLQEILKVRIKRTTNESGQVSIDEGINLNSTTVHLDFDLRYQNYSFRNKCLIIQDKSAKLGVYEVQIMEVS
ncbi:MAG: hypothetical protein IM607_15645 [Cytophagales bacterium]|nr:hypothetical protein [Cytophagales bacterium]